MTPQKGYCTPIYEIFTHKSLTKHHIESKCTGRKQSPVSLHLNSEDSAIIDKIMRCKTRYILKTKY